MGRDEIFEKIKWPRMSKGGTSLVVQWLRLHPPNVGDMGSIPGSIQFSCSVMSNSLRPHRLQHARLPCPSSTQSLLQLMSIELVMPSNHLIICRPLLLLLSIFPSIRVFSSESVFRIRWPKYSSFSIGPPSEYSGWFPLGWTAFFLILSFSSF